MKWLPVTKRGFTVIELLVVIVVIAILAAVSIVSYTGIQKRANGAVASSEVAQALKSITLYQAEYGRYPSLLSDAGLSSNNIQYSRTDSSYCLTATSGNVSYYVNSSGPTSPTEGGCPGHGVGGSPAITNLMPNPVGATDVDFWDSWGGSGGATTLSSVAAPWSSRGRAVRATWTASNTIAFDGDLGYYVPSWSGSDDLDRMHLQPNTQYTASWKLRTSKAQYIIPGVAIWRVEDGAMNSGTGSLDARSGPVATSPGSTYNQWITFTTGPNTISVKIFSALTSGGGATQWAVGDYMEASEFMLVEGSTVRAFADGASPSWMWSGPPNLSVSSGPTL